MDGKISTDDVYKEITEYENYHRGMLYRRDNNEEDVYMLTQLLFHEERKIVRLNFKNVFDATKELAYKLGREEGDGEADEIPLFVNHFQVGDSFETTGGLIYRLVGFKPKKKTRWGNYEASSSANVTAKSSRVKVLNLQGQVIYLSMEFLLTLKLL